MNLRCTAVCPLAIVLALCAACGGAPTAPAQAHRPSQTSVARSHAAGTIVSPEPHGAIMGQTGAPVNDRQRSAGQPATLSPAPDAPARPLTDFEESFGPFALAPGHDVLVVVHSKRLEEQPGKFNEAVAWLEIRDATGAVRYHQDYAFTVERGAFNDQCSVEAKPLAGSNGKGILIGSRCEPSAPLGAVSWRLFGLDEGKVVPFGKPLFVEGDVERFVPGEIRRQGSATMVLADVLEFKVFTGNFFVIVPLRVNWMQAKLEPGMRCYRVGGRGMEESVCEVPVVDVQRVPSEQEMTFVRLFPEADERMIPAHVVVRRDSKVEILAAKIRTVLAEHGDTMSLDVADGPWLDVRVDGKEGWIHTQEDFQAIGLPQAG